MKTALYRDKKIKLHCRLPKRQSLPRLRPEKKQKLELVAKLWHQPNTELGANAMHKDTNAAHAIYAKAQEHNYPELQIKKSGQLIGPDSIKRLLPELREQGEIG